MQELMTEFVETFYKDYWSIKKRRLEAAFFKFK